MNTSVVASRGTSPRVVLGMTLCNNARFLPDAAASILGQTYREFALLMLDDASSDETPRIAQSLAEHDGRVRLFRHADRLGMLPTWREVVELATREFPSAEYFAWVSDHDRWHPQWLVKMVEALDSRPTVVLAYPMTERMEPDGTPVEKDARTFQTVGLNRLEDRWREFCHRGVGSGDMVYGLMRISALRAAGVFREVVNPDRLLIAELTLQGEIQQVREPLWLRRRSSVASIRRQRITLIAGKTPAWFPWPAVLQHAYVMRREYLRSPHPPIRIPAGQLYRMLARYQVTSAWRSFRKTGASKAVGRIGENVAFAAKVARKQMRVTVTEAVEYVAVSRVRLGRRRRKLAYESAFRARKAAGRIRRVQQRTRYMVGSAIRRVF